LFYVFLGLGENPAVNFLKPAENQKNYGLGSILVTMYMPKCQSTVQCLWSGSRTFPSGHFPSNKMQRTLLK